MSHPLLEKNPNKKPLAEHIFLVSLATGGESEAQPLTYQRNREENKQKLCLWLLHSGKKTSPLLFFRQPLGLMIPGSFAGLDSYSML